MPSPITTSGFQVQAQPGIRYLDPSLLTANSSALLPAFSQGLANYGSLQQIADEAQARPIRQRLQQIQLDNAQSQASLLPLETARKRITLSQPINDISNIGVTSFARPTTQVQDTNPDGSPAFHENGDPVMVDAPVQNDRYLTQLGTSTDPVTGVVSDLNQRSKVISTAEQEAAAAAHADYLKNISEAKLKGKDFESENLINGYNAAMEAGDQDTAAMYKKLIDRKSAIPGMLGAGVTYDRTIERLAAEAGKPLAEARQMAATPEGAAQLAALGQRNRRLNTSSGALQESIVGDLASAPKAAVPVFTVPGLSAPAAPSVAPGSTDSPIVQDFLKAYQPPGAVQIDISKPITAAQAATLPSGTVFIGIDGIRRTKH